MSESFNDFAARMLALTDDPAHRQEIINLWRDHNRRMRRSERIEFVVIATAVSTLVALVVGSLGCLL